MPDWAGSKADAPTKPHKSSRLRNEVLAESIDDERAGDGSRIEVPDSDIVIPETQPDNGEINAEEFGDGLGPGGNASSHLLSPKTHAVVSRNRVTRSRETPAAPPNVQYFSRPSKVGELEPHLNFHFTPAGKIVSKQTPKVKPAPIPLAVFTTVAPTAQEPVTVPDKRKYYVRPGFFAGLLTSPMQITLQMRTGRVILKQRPTSSYPRYRRKR
jgi:hypothetical protein